ncbi:putative reverse transcriptase domain-containing protein [Tanacetum coccineum]
MNRAPRKAGNQLALEGSRNNRSNGNQVRGIASTFISTEFVPLLNVRPSIVNPGYVIEVADGKKVEVDRIIRDCKLELGGSLFSINLKPLGHGSFDVIVGMNWLSQHKALIVCHEKVVEIPVEDDVFPEDLSGLPQQRQVEFCIDLILGVTPVAKIKIASGNARSDSDCQWHVGVEEKITLKEVDGQTVEEIETKIIAKDGTITRVPGKFQKETSKEEKVEQPKRHDLYGFVDHPQLQQGNPMNEFAPHRLPQPKQQEMDVDRREEEVREMKWTFEP